LRTPRKINSKWCLYQWWAYHRYQLLVRQTHEASNKENIIRHSYFAWIKSLKPAATTNASVLVQS